MPSSSLSFLLVAVCPPFLLVRTDSSEEYTFGLESVVSRGAKADKEMTYSSVLVEIACFCFAFAVIRMVCKPMLGTGGKRVHLPKKVCGEPSEPEPQEPSTLEEWRRVSKKGPVSSQDLQAWASKVFVDAPEAFLPEFVGYLVKLRDSPELADAVNILLRIPSKAGRPDLVEALSNAARKEAGAVTDTASVRQAFLGAFAAKGESQQVEKLLAEERAEREGHKATMRSFASVVRGYLRCGKINEVVGKFGEMRCEGHEVPDGAVTELVRAACKAGADLWEILASLDGVVQLPQQAVSIMLAHCVMNEDLQTAKVIRTTVQRGRNPQLAEDSYNYLLRLYVKADSEAGIETLASMLAEGFKPCEGLCRFVIARCADSRNVPLAEALCEYLRERGQMTFATYKCLMKVYAYSMLYDKACDLYAEILSVGMEPDSVMYGSLMKFATKAGRTAMSQEIFEKTDGGSCVQNFMWLIRAAGHDGDVDRAVGIFRRLQQAQPKLVDAIAFNIVIDACASNKDIERAKELLEEMRQTYSFNLVTYNTIMKGHIAAGDVKAAQAVLHDMHVAGIEPDCATFSCLLNGALKLGNLKESWLVISEMDRRGIPIDSYIISTMMQAARKVQSPRDADRLLTILDRPDVCICDDEVVFNTVLDACIYRRDCRRLARSVEAYPTSSVIPTVRTFGLLIKACIVLKRTTHCWQFWNEMVKERGLMPNDVTLGCMTDALVEAKRVDDALALFQQWKPKVQCDTIIYSTLIKGFSQIGDSERATALYKDMKLNGIQMNSIAYTALINAHTRNGLMKKAEALLVEMEKDGCQPNTITYSSLLKGYCARGHLEAALRLFQRMMQIGLEADVVMFNTLLDGCVQKGSWMLSDELLKEMQRLNVPPSNFTLSIKVKMWSKRGDLDQAFECIHSALRSPQGYKLVDPQVGACIVGACMHNRNPERALQVLEEMKGWKHFDGPCANTYSALISGLPRYGMLRKAVELAEEACGVLSTTVCGQDKRPLAQNALMQLFRALKYEGLLQELGYPLEARLRRAGMKVDEQWLL